MSLRGVASVHESVSVAKLRKVSYMEGGGLASALDLASVVSHSERGWSLESNCPAAAASA